MRRFEVLAFTVCMIVTIGLYFSVSKKDELSAKALFETVADQGFDEATQRLERYAHALQSVTALFDASDQVTEQDFSAFVRSFDLIDRSPALEGVGYLFIDETGGSSGFFMGSPDAGQIDPAKLGPDLIPSIKSDVNPIFTITAVEDGFADITSAPLYMVNLIRRQSHQMNGDVGWVYATIDGAQAFANLVRKQGESYTLGISIQKDSTGVSQVQAGDAQSTSLFTTTRNLPAYGQTWTFTFASTPAFEAYYLNNSRYFILIVGLIWSSLLSIVIRSINVRQQARAELSELQARQFTSSEMEKESILDNALTSVIIFDANERIVHANSAAQKIFGYDLVELVGLPFSRLATKAEFDGNIGNFRALGQTKSNSLLSLDVQLNSWASSTGASRTTAIIRDVTAEHLALEMLKDSQKRHDLALSGAKIGVFELDIQSGTSEVSDSWFEVMGLPVNRETFETQKHFLQRVHPDDMPALIETNRACVAGEAERSTAEYRLKFGLDEWRWMRSDAVPIHRCANGRALTLVGVQSDITMLREAQLALEASQSRFRLAMIAAPVGMALMNDKGQFLEVNKAVCDFSGYSAEALRESVQMSDLFEHEDFKKMYRAVMANLESEMDQIYRGEHRLVLKSGSRRWGLFSVASTFDHRTQSHMFIIQINDIEDQKEVEKIKSEFVSTVSHELRTPLTSIAGAIGIIQATASKDLPPAVCRLIDIAKSNADKLASLINDILDLEKISSGETPFNLEAVDICSLVEDIVDSMEPEALAHKNILVADIPEGDLAVIADTERMQQVIANLVSNACKYSSDDTDITIKVEKVSDKALVCVVNEGPGVPDHFRSKVFASFSQADSSDTRSKGGTGLGLNISRQIVLRLGGEIGFESSEDGPTVFWFTCPLAGRDASLPDDSSMENHVQNRKIQVLHLEEDKDFAEVIRSALAEVAEVTHVMCIPEARKIIDERTFDAVILDRGLSDATAHNFLDQIKQSQPQTKILSLSAQEATQDDGRVDLNMVKSRTKISSLMRVIAGGAA